MSPAVAAIQTLLEYIKKPSFGTVSELREKVVHAIDELTTAWYAGAKAAILFHVGAPNTICIS